MRYLSHFFWLLIGISSLSFPAWARTSGPASPPPSSFQRIRLSHKITGKALNISRSFTSNYTELSAQGETTTDGPLMYERVIRQAVHLKIHGTRTTLPMGRQQEQRYSATVPTSVVTLMSVFLIQCRFLFVAGICLLWVFSSPRGIGPFLQNLWALILWCFKFFVVRPLICYWDTIIWVDDSIEYLIPWLVNVITSLRAPFHRLRDSLDAREREWERIRCILRKKDIRKSHARPSGQRSATPLFREQAPNAIQHIYLPEERDDPLRHMRDPRHFSHLQKIGAGAFGSICLVENRITGKKMAMKSLLQKDNSSEEINLEIRALLRAQESGWFPKLLSTFMDAVNFYILMPFYPHGDLYSVMTSSGGCLSRELCQFYLAELILALQCLHKTGIIHRDIKPDNILFDETGHLVVADLGVAHVFIEDEEDDTFMADEYPLWEEMKSLNDDGFPLLTPSIDNPHTIKGVAGTPFYAAPEVLGGRLYSYGVDYYSLAIVYHEMVTGYVPIQCGPCLPGRSEPTITLDLGKKDVHFQPISVSDYDFLSQMLDEDCYARPNVKQMKDHPVLAGIDWDKLSRREGPIPQPKVLRKRVPISPGFERCLTNSSRA